MADDICVCSCAETDPIKIPDGARVRVTKIHIGDSLYFIEGSQAIIGVEGTLLAHFPDELQNDPSLHAPGECVPFPSSGTRGTCCIRYEEPICHILKFESAEGLFLVDGQEHSTMIFADVEIEEVKHG